MTPNDINAAIVRTGTSQAAIAEYLGVCKTSIWRVVNGSMRSKRIEAELQKITGQPIHLSNAKRGRQKKIWTGAVVNTTHGIGK